MKNGGKKRSWSLSCLHRYLAACPRNRFLVPGTEPHLGVPAGVLRGVRIREAGSFMVGK